MRKHISIFTFLLCAFAAVGTAGTAAGAMAKKGGFVYLVEGGSGSRNMNQVYSTDEKYHDYVAIPPAGRKIGNWGWAEDASKIMKYDKVEWENPPKTGVNYSIELKPTATEVAVYFAYIPLTVSFNGNGGSGSMTAIKDQNYDSDITLPANTFAKTGYQFTGWKTNATKGVVFEDKAQPKGSTFWNGESFDSTLYAQWAANTYTVHFDGNGATDGSMQDETFTYDEEQALTANAFVKNGYSFAGWATNATEGAVLYADRALVKNLTVANGGTVSLYARWTASPYTVTFNANGGGTPSPTTKSVTYGSTYGQLATCSRTGYSLDGWYTAASGGTKIETTTTVAITAAQTLYAHWTPVSYTINYTGLKQGTTHSNPLSYTIESDTIVFSAPSETVGYKFNGWSPASIEKGSTGSKTVTASYLTITYRPAIHSPRTYNGYSQACFQLPLPTGVVAETPGEARAVGTYTTTFRPTSGYCWDDGTTAPYVVEWKIIAAAITDAKVVQTGTLTYTGEPQQPTVYASATVVGSQPTWKYSRTSGGYVEGLPEFTDAGDYTVYFEVSAPNYEPATGSFTVTVKRAREATAVVSPTHLPYTKREQGPTVTLQHCHETEGSVKRAMDVGTYAVKVTPDENYAWSNGETAVRELEWSIDDSLYTVQFDANGGMGEMASTNLAYNEEYIVPECGFAKTGCEFESWQVIIDSRTVTNYSAGTVVSNLTSAAGKIVTFKAVWTGYYTIAFDANGGDGEMVATNVERDVGFQLPSNAFTRTGYDFTMWTTNLPPNEKSLIADGATVTNLVTAGETCTLHALWDPHHYAIIFDANGGKGENPPNKSCVYGKEYELPRDWSYTPPKNYATFIGWSTNKSDTVGVYTVSNLTAEAGGVVTVYAVWEYDVGPWSDVLDCDNLKFENVNGTYPWIVEDDGAVTGSDKCLTHIGDGGPQGYGRVYAELDESGTLTYWWKGKGDGDLHEFWVCLTAEPKWDTEIAEKTSIDSHDVRQDQGWTKSTVKITVPADEKRYIWFAHNASISVSIDCVTWTPEGGGEPMPGDPVKVEAAGVENGVFSLTIPAKSAESGKDYGVWTNADLTVDSWGLMGKPQSGEGKPLEFKWTILPGFPQLFFRAHKVEYK